MGGKKRGKNRETVTVEQGARNENEKEKEEVDLFDWYMLGMGEVKEMEDGDLFDGCFFLVRANSSKTIPTTTTETSISNRSLCHQEDFHYIDLVLKFTIPYYLPSIINCIGTGTMLSFNNSEVFILGDQSQPLFQHNHDVDNPIHKHTDNIIFFHPEDVYDRRDLLLAYDMNTSTWLRIVWDFSNIDNFLIVYDAIFTLSNKGLMCLASGICGSSVQFLRFRVKRTSDTHLKLTAIDYHKYNIPSATRISDIIFF
ncbi:uncharacterized protein LOC141591025 isoform X2 [Silene latifolia]|uniref:uncharacterized protein LOC141591025 isoform X2 n=1 Tax=Silene latifolia TaxID=37657 RepID=UPI003D774AA1